MVQFVCEVGRSQAVKALVDEYCQLEVDPQWNLQPVQLTQEWCDMVVLQILSFATSCYYVYITLPRLIIQT